MAPRRAAPEGSMPPPSRASSPPIDQLDEAPFFDNIDELQQHGINMQDILKLKSAAINTVTGVGMTTRRQLLKIKVCPTFSVARFDTWCGQGMSEAKVEKIKEAAQKITGSSFATGVEVQDRRRRVLVISTGSKSVDSILGGGLMSQSITEGLCFLSLHRGLLTVKTLAALLEKYVQENNLVIETKERRSHTLIQKSQGTFRPDRIRAIADRFGVDGSMALENILYARAFNSEHQMELINECSMRFAEDKDFRLIIVDSIMALFRVDYSGRGELSERQQKSSSTNANQDIQLAQMLSKLVKLAEEYNIAVLITNQVQADPGATMTFVAGGALKPVGGHILSHASATRIFLRKGRAEERVAKLVDSPDRPESEASYKLDEGGWSDV
ncbi:Rad51-domain-containing protein [Pisolithus microcarpus]|nr:Rad51-domain-containing protein [Pisolithus microcarpus]